MRHRMLVNVRCMSFYEGSEALVFVRSLNRSWTSPLLLRGNPGVHIHGPSWKYFT